MKENAPEKIYVHIKDKPFEITFSEVIEKECSNIEYTRTDAFIEKAAKWLEDNAIEYWGTEAVDNGMMIVEFKKAMRL